ncbi:TerB family tellurite resistance protein [Methylophilaceae bacterium]|nr:TerB family tellurite resistance protein [Methylophilaceae bacterium]
METLLIIIFWLCIIFGFGRVFGWFSGGAKAAYNAATKGTNIVDNLKEEFYQMGPLEVRTEKGRENLGDKEFDVEKIEVRGFVNNTELAHNLQFVISLFDVTDEKGKDKKFDKPILTNVNELMEPESRAFQLKLPLGNVGAMNGYTKWVPIQRIFPDFLVGAKKGKRKIRGIIRAIPDTEADLKSIYAGLQDRDRLYTAFASFDFEAKLNEVGYDELKENFFKIRSYCVQFAVLMAFSDGELDASEGNIIKKWIANQIDIETNEERKTKLKVILNETLKKAYANAKAGKIEMEKLINEFKKITTEGNSLAMLEFLFEVIGADGKIDDAEMKTVNSIASKLGVSVDTVKSMTDKMFLDIDDHGMDQGESAENVLGITDDMSKEEIKKLLNKQFRQWNGRIQSLEDGEEKEKAQVMLNIIADTKKKYE